MVKSKSLVALTTLILLLLAVGTASAGLGTSGSKLEKEVSPGEHLTHVMQVKSDASDPPMDIQVELLGYGQAPNGANRELNASGRYSGCNLGRGYSQRRWIREQICPCKDTNRCHGEGNGRIHPGDRRSNLAYYHRI